MPENKAYTCADVDAQWGNDWQAVISALDELMNQGQACGDEPLLSKKYAAHFNYASSLEANGELDAAIENYTSAFLIDANRAEALNALTRLGDQTIQRIVVTRCRNQRPFPVTQIWHRCQTHPLRNSQMNRCLFKCVATDCFYTTSLIK